MKGRKRFGNNNQFRNTTKKDFKQFSNPLDVCENCKSDTPAMTTNSECPYCHKKL